MKDIALWVVYAGLFSVPFLTLYVENEYFFPFITGKNFWFRILIDITVAAYVILACYEPKFRPKWSWITGGAAALLVVMFFANILGEYPRASFWSNFERMDGYVSLVHMFLYMLVLSAVLQTKKAWLRLFGVSLMVAGMVAFGGLGQYFDIDWIRSLLSVGASPNRLDSTLGNAAYMAIYMLFHIFLALYVAVQNIPLWQRIVAGISIPMFLFVLIETGTRGTAIGFAVGLMALAAYVGVYAKKQPVLRMISISACVAVLAIGGLFYAAKDSSFVQNNGNINRIANISLSDLTVRGTVWQMAWEGVQERPALGYGQSNFNYVFNTHYDPFMFNQESWFDRAHNIFLDWLITGGVLGLLTYLSIWAACLYYLLAKSSKLRERMTVVERGIFFGLLLGYFTHNLVVFDNIISYMFFAMVLGFLHMQVGKPLQKIEKIKIDPAIIKQVVAPVCVVAAVVVIVFVHRPGMLAAKDIIDAMRAFSVNGPDAALEEFQSALDRDSFAQQEIIEQLSQQAVRVTRTEGVSAESRERFVLFTEEQIAALIVEKPTDARVRVFAANYYQNTGQLEAAIEQSDIARTLSPDKPAIIMQQGSLAFQLGNTEEAKEFYKTAFLLDERNTPARIQYAATALLTNDIGQAELLAETDEIKAAFANNEFLRQTAISVSAYDFLVDLYEARVRISQTNPQYWVSLAAAHIEVGDRPQAVQVLSDAAQAMPLFADTAACMSTNILSGKANPGEGC